MGFLRHLRKCNGCQHFSAATTACQLACAVRPDPESHRSQVYYATNSKECTARRRTFSDASLNIKMIAAVGADRAIGYEQQLLFRIPSDLKHFKSTTLGGVLLMGRKTFESLPGVLPGREHWVLSSNMALSSHPNVKVFSTLAALFEHAYTALGKRILWVAGGGEIYRRLMPYANELVLTEISATAVQADTYFPSIPQAFMPVSRTDCQQGPNDAFAYTIARYQTAQAEAYAHLELADE